MSSTHACEGGSEPGGSEAGVGSTARSRPRPPHCPSGSSGETHRGPQKEPREGLLGGGVSFAATGVGGQRGVRRHSHMQEGVLGQGKVTGGRGGQGSEQTVWPAEAAGQLWSAQQGPSTALPQTSQVTMYPGSHSLPTTRIGPAQPTSKEDRRQTNKDMEVFSITDWGDTDQKSKIPPHTHTRLLQKKRNRCWGGCGGG